MVREGELLHEMWSLLYFSELDQFLYALEVFYSVYLSLWGECKGMLPNNGSDSQDYGYLNHL